MTSEWKIALELTSYEYVVTCLRDRIHAMVRDTPGVKVIDWGGYTEPDSHSVVYEMFQADTETAIKVRQKVETLTRREVEMSEIDPEDAVLKADEAQELVMVRTWPVILEELMEEPV
jgi:hypothetical protein